MNKTPFMPPLNPLVNAKRQIIAYSGQYSETLCKLNPKLIFVFGDNLQRVGNGGQAAIRPQPNVLGVATKVTPGNDFFSDLPHHMGQVMSELLVVNQRLSEGCRIVLPITKEKRISLGCGLAELPYRAPLVYATIEAWFRSLKNVEYVS